MERRLAAILAADVVGYSRLMGEDEAGTLKALRAQLDDLVAPTIAGHGGRIVRLIGDGLLVEFPSAVKAVQCAVALQAAVAAENGPLPAEKRIEWRIGINVGDIIVSDGDIHGDGVNIAARLEALAEPGGIWVSGTVVDNVGKKIDRGFEDLGEKTVKNIATPIRVYRVAASAGAESPPRVTERRRWPLAAAVGAVALLLAGALLWWQTPREPAPPSPAAESASIAVLPFANKSEAADHPWFAEGLTDDIIVELTKLPRLRVISRETTATIREEAPDLRELAALLKARYVLQGSVRRAENRVRISATLIEAATGQHVWGDRYDGDLADIFMLQDTITEKIAAALELKLSPADRENLARPETADLQAYDLFLQGRDRFFRFSRESTYRARDLYEQALARDPGFARVYAMLAWTHAFEYNNGWTDKPEHKLDQALELANRAVALDDRLPVAYFVKALVYRERHQYEAALAETQRAIDIDPSYANAYIMLSTLLYYTGEPEEGLAMIEMAERVNPAHPSNYPFHKGQALFILKRYDEAIETLEKGLTQNPTSQRLRVWLAVSYAQAGRTDDAEWEAEQILAADPDFRLGRLLQIFPFKESADLEHFNTALRKIGLDDRW